MTVGVPADVLDKRFQQHYAHAKIYVSARNNKPGQPELAVNPNGFFLAVKSAYDDIYRYREYHLPDASRSNSVKRAAYLCKWLCKMRPIEYQVAPKDITDINGLMVNADFALFLARSHMVSETGTHFRFSDQYQFELLYDLTYRSLDDDALLHIFQNVYTRFKLKNDIYEVI